MDGGFAGFRIIPACGDMQTTRFYNRVEIDPAAIASNYRAVKNLVGAQVRVMAIVKSDAYGHGLVPVASRLAEEGVEVFGVAEMDEGIRLRQAGIKGEIVVLLGAMVDAVPELVEYDLSPVVFDRDFLVSLSAYAVGCEKQVGVHLKVDTGMGRLGVMLEEEGAFLDLLEVLPGVRLAGVLSHFPLADSEDISRTEEQNQLFAAMLARVRERFGKCVAHIANSAAIINHQDTYYDLVRPGITLYGYYPAPDEKMREILLLKPAMSFKSRVIQIKELGSGAGISYGHTFRTVKPTRLAVLPVGYDDGYSRLLSGKAEVLIGGSRVPILGRICMNACMADITGLDQVKPGDEVVLMGRQGEAEITADHIAGWLGTISYEILCLLGGRNQRYYPDGSTRT